MLKGHTKIELTDVNTGKKDVIEEDNMLTDAISHLIKHKTAMQNCFSQSTNKLNNLFNLYNVGLGGLLIFEKPLTESSDNTEFPDNNKLVASADRTQNTTDALKGSLNVDESGFVNGGYRNVWDFSTSQANGTIQALSLCHKNMGNNPTFFGGRISYDNQEYTLLKHTVHNDDWYYGNIRTCRVFTYKDDYLYVASTSINDDKNKLIKRVKIPKDKVLATSISNSAENTIAELPNDFIVRDYCSYWSVDNNYYYRIGPGVYEQNPESRLIIKKLRISDLSFEQEADEIIPIGDKEQGTNIYNTYSSDYMSLTTNKIFVVETDRKHIYIVDRQNTSSIDRIDVYSGDPNEGSGSWYIRYIRPITRNGPIVVIYVKTVNGSTVNREAILYSDGRIVYRKNVAPPEYPTSSSGAYYDSYVSNSQVQIDRHIQTITPNTESSSTSDYMYVGTEIANNYLGTINNLSSPITKQNTQTMKVTYTLYDTEG